MLLATINSSLDLPEFIHMSITQNYCALIQRIVALLTSLPLS